MNFNRASLSETADIETSSDDYARRFEGEIGKWFLQIQEEATLRMLSGFQGRRILDVGGGHGQLTPGLIRQGFDVTVLGSDEVCRNRIKPFLRKGQCQFKVGDILNLPYQNQSFDGVVSFRLLPHVGEWKRFLGEITRVSQKMVLIDYPTVKSVNSMTPLFFNFKKRLEGNTRGYTSFHEKELLEIFKLHGFIPESRFPEFFLPMVLHRVLKSPKVSSMTEKIFRKLGLTSLLGSPVILKLVRESVNS
ncbi:MAG: class I SAM-dependent methyltransferase [Chlamydiae bacterium]|nr:class I SAM-dependent methyltransferase [Chlamydiota bacterium]MBI3276597.1 class I SAM-dependent methyltransferase [Chlamydiota bacterium]